MGQADGRPLHRALAAGAGVAGLAAAAPAALMAAPFWAVSALVRRLPTWFALSPDVTPWTDAMEYLPEVGWRTKPNVDAFFEAEGVFRVTTDEEGWRGSMRLDDADAVVFGDSFAFGQGADDAGMYTERVAGKRIKSLGSNGYSMVHAVLWMQRMAPRLGGKRVFWMIYLGNDLYDNLRPNYHQYRMPYVRNRGSGWEIHTDHVSREPWPFTEPDATPAEGLARVCTAGPEADRAIEAACYLLDQAHATCEQAGGSLTVLSVPRRDQVDGDRAGSLRALSPAPDRFDTGMPDRRLHQHAQARGIGYVPLAQHLSPRDYFERDIHWRPSGHAKVADVLAQHLR